MLYLIESAGYKEDNYFKLLKIGYTEDSKEDVRFMQYKMHNPTCQVLYTIPEATEDHERRVQYKFKKLLFPDYGREWFKYDQSIVDFFKNIKSLEELERLPKGNSDKKKFLKYKNKVKEILKYISNVSYQDIDKFKDLCEEVYDILGDKIKDKDYVINYFKSRFDNNKIENYFKIKNSRKTGIYCENSDLNQEVSKFMRIYDSYNTKYDKLRLLCEYELSNDAIKIVLAQISDSDEIKSYYLALGPQKLYSLGYNITRIRKALGVVVFSDELLLDSMYSNFKEGEKYTLINLKNKIGSIYSSINYSRTPKAVDIEKWFDVKNIKIYEKN